MEELEVPLSHPRAESLRIRHRLIEGFRRGLVAEAGLIAHGRGEALDYLLGEATQPFAVEAAKAGVAYLLLAERPVVSVNGNAAALVAEDLVKLAKVVGARLEVNLFYRSYEREALIASELRKAGAEEVLGVGEAASATIPELHSHRRRVDPRGILAADVVLVPLEDGDRTEALRRMGKVVVAVDLNPLSRTAKAANVTVVDNIVRAVPLMVKLAEEMRSWSREELRKVADAYDNEGALSQALLSIKSRLSSLAGLGSLL
ncbi:MAG: 4-phosphopantoate--beta-alanine ligase [Candidatus Nezhaarchaeota archaeon]|nr:4-phosphopantoate--beta-alanine ligase [Candidatus Nezhaarchaeota archaeon]